MAQRKYAQAELERAKEERDITANALTLSASRERAVTLERVRQETFTGILAADLESKNRLVRLIEGEGAFGVTFSDGSNSIDKGVPRISWQWTPFENAVIKIYRNQGTILEEIKQVSEKATLIHVEAYEPKGDYLDKEAMAGNTYNYYAYIETRRTGVRPRPITRDLPSEVSTGLVIDENGAEITTFETHEPEVYEEPFYSGFRYRRMVIEPYIDERAKRRRSLSERREEIELAEEEQELERLERDVGLRSGTLDANQLEHIIEEAKRLTDRDSTTRQAEAMLAGRDDIDDRQRELILAYIRKATYR